MKYEPVISGTCTVDFAPVLTGTGGLGKILKKKSMKPVPVPVPVPVQVQLPVPIPVQVYHLYQTCTGRTTCTGTGTDAGTGFIGFFFKIFLGPPVPVSTGASCTGGITCTSEIYTCTIRHLFCTCTHEVPG